MPDEIPKSAPAAFIHSRLDDLGLTPVQFRVYGHIHRRAGNNGIYFESVPNCAGHCGLNIKTVRGAIARLKALGLIRLENARPGETNTYAVTAIEEWPPLPIGYPGTQLGRVSDREATPTNPDPGTPVFKREATPTNSIPPKVIPVSYSHKGNPAKGEVPPQLAKVHGWQLTKDRKELRAQIRELNESSNPDAELLAGLKAQLGEINQAIRNRGAIRPATGAKATAATPANQTPQETAKLFNVHVEKTPHEVAEMMKQLREVVNGKPA